MDSAQIQRLREEVGPKLIELLNSSNLADLLQEHGISAREAISLEVKVDTTKLETRAASRGQELQNFPQTLVVFDACAGPCPDNPHKTCWGSC